MNTDSHDKREMQIRERAGRQRRETEKAQLLASTPAEEAHETLVIELLNDIDFLLSLLDSQADKSYAERTPIGVRIANDAATRMRKACVAAIRGLRHKSETDESRWNVALYHAEKTLESITLDGEKER